MVAGMKEHRTPGVFGGGGGVGAGGGGYCVVALTQVKHAMLPLLGCRQSRGQILLEIVLSPGHNSTGTSLMGWTGLR